VIPGGIRSAIDNSGIFLQTGRFEKIIQPVPPHRDGMKKHREMIGFQLVIKAKVVRTEW
jgi:hypothetical protein